MLIKTYARKPSQEIHRFPYAGNFESLVNIVGSYTLSPFRLVYVDDERDVCLIDGALEFEEACRQFEGQIMRLIILTGDLEDALPSLRESCMKLENAKNLDQREQLERLEAQLQEKMGEVTSLQHRAQEVENTAASVRSELEAKIKAHEDITVELAHKEAALEAAQKQLETIESKQPTQQKHGEVRTLSAQQLVAQNRSICIELETEAAQRKANVANLQELAKHDLANAPSNATPDNDSAPTPVIREDKSGGKDGPCDCWKRLQLQATYMKEEQAWCAVYYSTGNQLSSLDFLEQIAIAPRKRQARNGARRLVKCTNGCKDTTEWKERGNHTFPVCKSQKAASENESTSGHEGFPKPMGYHRIGSRNAKWRLLKQLSTGGYRLNHRRR